MGTPEQEQRALEAKERLARYTTDPLQETIDGIVYTSEKFGASAAIGFLSRLGHVLGGDGLRLIVMGSSTLSNLFASAVRDGRMLDAIATILANLRMDPNLAKDLLGRTRCAALRPAGEGPVSPVFDTHFKGELPHLIAVLHFVLTHNFAGFSLGFPSPHGSRIENETAGATL